MKSLLISILILVCICASGCRQPVQNQIGLTELPESWADIIRSCFNTDDAPFFDAPARVIVQHHSDCGFFIKNYNQKIITLNILLAGNAAIRDGFTGEMIGDGRKNIELEMKPRSRIWLTTSEK
jgi:hypothetical protein